MSLGKKAKGSLIYHGNGASPEVFTKIDEVFSIGAIGSQGDLIDFTNHDTTDLMDYQAADLEDGNTIQVEANEIPGNASQELVWTARDDKTVDNWKVVLKNGKTFIFPGVTLSAEVDASDLKGRQVFRFQVKIAGAMTRTNPA